MEKLILLQSTTQKALSRLQEALIRTEEKIKQSQDEFDILAAQELTIKRFGLSFGQFWKLSKLFLETKKNFEELNNPRTTFEALVKAQLCTEKDGESLASMLADRNTTTHCYDEKTAKQIYPNIHLYYEIMSKILKKIEL
jgi:nucleotidyltransferase substrate binding protein (TIGR01987 family)